MNKTALFRISVCTLILSLVIGCIITLVELILDIINLKSDENGEITIPSGFLDFL